MGIVGFKRDKATGGISQKSEPLGWSRDNVGLNWQVKVKGQHFRYR